MFIAHVYFPVAAADRSNALQTLIAEAAVVRAMNGCNAFIPFADPTNDDSLGIVHEWESEAHFRAYLASECFAHSGRILRPLMTGAPVSRRFDATLRESVN